MAKCVKCGRNMPGFGFGKRICQWCVQYEAAQRGEEPENAVQPIMAAPWTRLDVDSMMVTKAFVAINAMIFVAMILNGVSATNPTSEQLIRWGANFGPYTLSGEWWRLLTSVFLHIGIIHILFNMWCLWDLGQLVESLYGSTTFFVVYLACGVAGSLASAAFHTTVSAGASGAIFGLAGVLISSFYLGDFALPRSIIRMRLRSIVMFVGYNVVFGLISGFTDNYAHFGGLIAGLMFGALLAKLAPDSDAHFTRAAVVLVGVLVVAGCGLWAFHANGGAGRSRADYSSSGGVMINQVVRKYEDEAKKNPNDPQAHSRLAMMYASVGEFDKAEAEWKRVIELKPQDPQTFVGLAAFYQYAQRPADAQAAYRRAIALNPNSATAHYGLARLASSQGDCKAVEEESVAARKIDPTWASNFDYLVGQCYSNASKWDEAIAAYRRHQAAYGDDAETEHGLAGAYSAKGMEKEAEAARQKAAELEDKE